MSNTRQLTKAEAIAFGESGAWKQMSHEERARFQIEQEYLCMPFGEFHEAVEKALGRPVWSHEFGLNVDGLKAELARTWSAPSFDEIVAMLPAEKCVIAALNEPQP